MRISDWSSDVCSSDLLPAVLGAFEDQPVVKEVEDFLARHAQRIEQAGDRQLALAVDADVDDVLGVEFEIEPRTAIRDHARGEQELARRVRPAAVVPDTPPRRTRPAEPGGGNEGGRA